MTNGKGIVQLYNVVVNGSKANPMDVHVTVNLLTYASIVTLMQPMEGSLCLLSAALTNEWGKK